jgi:hypothetical protein
MVRFGLVLVRVGHSVTLWCDGGFILDSPGRIIQLELEILWGVIQLELETHCRVIQFELDVCCHVVQLELEFPCSVI